MKARLPQGFGKQDRGQLMAQYQKLQEDMQQLTEDLESREHTAAAGGGQVEVTIDGSYNVKKVTINPDVLDPEDVELLEDMVAAAMNAAVGMVKDTQEKEMGALTGGLGLPGLM